MRASRSSAATGAPQRIILSISLVQTRRSSCCCTMMAAVWQPRHATRAFSCIGPGGRPLVSACADARGAWAASSPPSSAAATAPMHSDATAALRLDMDAHPVDHVPEIPGRIPRRLGGLRPSGAVGGPRHHYVGAACGWLPDVLPKSPGVWRLVPAEGGRLPGAALVGGNVHSRHLLLAGPGGAGDADGARLPVRAVARARNDGLHRQSGNYGGFVRADLAARRHAPVGEPVARLH